VKKEKENHACMGSEEKQITKVLRSTSTLKLNSGRCFWAFNQEIIARYLTCGLGIVFS